MPSQDRYKTKEERDRENLAYGAAILLIGGWFGFPEVLFGAGLGLILAAPVPPRISDPEARGRWRRIGRWELASGVGLVGFCAALWRAADLGGEISRFTHAWHRSVFAIHPHALIAYPWGWAPIAIAIALIGAGAYTRYRAQ